MARQYLKKKIVLAGESDGKVFRRTFNIEKKISEGSSVICYEAYHGTSGKGILKEFYPEDAYALERNKEGQLVHADGFDAEKERFLKMEKEYTMPYQVLLHAKKSKDNDDLATFIPAFEMYHGCDNEGTVVGSTYIWTPEPKLETFDNICNDIHKHPKKKPEHKLVMVLSAIESLSKCICALHEAELIHRDIKPSNFGFIRRANETLTQTISMFDVNSICSVYDDSEEVVGTPGFLEPEAGYLAVSNQTDIYAIGATLFQAIIVCDELKDSNYTYNYDMYKDIRTYVDNSKLITASESNSHPRLRNILVTILEKCLAKRNDRYTNCEELLEDIGKALYYALPSDVAQKKVSGEQWVLRDVENSLSKSIEKNSNDSIQYLLYKNPLYRCVERNNSVLDVMIIGFGNYGQKFLDICLQLGQMPFKDLRVVVLTDDITDKEIYLRERPALVDFFTVDDENCKDSTNYGTIIFEVAKLSRDENGNNREVIDNILSRYSKTQKPSYCFIALGDDKMNVKTAYEVNNILINMDAKAIVSFAQEKMNKNVKYDDSMKPVYVCESIKADPMYAEIERMAFNAHLIWEKDLNINYAKVKKAFKKSYNHHSCVMNVLFMKYKLYSLGIDLDNCSCKEAAKLFVESGLLHDKSSRILKDTVVYVEHKRWVTEKVCLGWQKLDDISLCQRGITKDEKSKRHVCLVKSCPNQILTQNFRSNGSYEKWDTATNEELSQLDELDRVSVELHRLYCKQAEKIKRENIINGYVISSIKSLIASEKKIVFAYQEWYSCIKDIWNGDSSKVMLYDGLKNALLMVVENSNTENRYTISEQIRLFDSMFYPILASMRHIDYKQLDLAYIDNIPFMLTYSENIFLAIPYSEGSNTELFSNLAMATMVNPARIMYLFHVEHKQDMAQIKNNLPYMLGFMKKKDLRATVDFVFICANKDEAYISKDDELEIKNIGSGRIRNIKVLWVDNTSEISIQLIEYLKYRNQSNRLFAIEKNNSKLSYLLLGAGVYNEMPYYEYDIKTMSFVSMVDCEELAYIKKHPHISVADMMSISLSSSDSCNQPEFYGDYKQLWTKYHERTGNWKLLCNTLKKYAENNDVISKFKKIKDKKAGEVLRYVLPYSCFETVSKILCFLIKNEVIESESMINVCTTDSLEVLIIDRIGYKEKFDQLFSGVYMLMDADALTMYYNAKNREVVVVFDNLLVTGLELPTNKNNELLPLLKYFSENGFLINLTSVQSKVSFTYSTRRIKELLTNEGKMLEVYTYHKIKELGKFDDIVSSYEIDWENTEVKNEFDCIVTKGFKTIFIECKARTDIDQEFYYKLSSLAERFGINSTAVLIADTEERSFYENIKRNNIQRKRGSMMNVITVWKKEDINNIGHTLLKIMNGTYVDEE